MASTLAKPGVQDGGTIRQGWGEFRSYDCEGTMFSWLPPSRLRFSRAALDVETKDQEVGWISAHYGLPQDVFLRRWTVTEAVAKLLDQPIFDFIRREGLCAEAADEWFMERQHLWVRNLDHSTHWITVAIAL